VKCLKDLILLTTNYFPVATKCIENVGVVRMWVGRCHINALYTLDIFAHLKFRHCDKKILRHLTIFSNIFLLTNQGKLLRTPAGIGLIFVKSSHWLVIEIHGSKLTTSFFLFITILCNNIFSV
jgi:hypothetical protein